MSSVINDYKISQLIERQGRKAAIEMTTNKDKNYWNEMTSSRLFNYTYN